MSRRVTRTNTHLLLILEKSFDRGGVLHIFSVFRARQRELPSRSSQGLSVTHSRRELFSPSRGLKRAIIIAYAFPGLQTSLGKMDKGASGGMGKR
jgi:hypothetical protein